MMASTSVTAAAIAFAYTAALPVASPPFSRECVSWPCYGVARPFGSSAVSAHFAAQSQLDDICRLTAGWDGYGALPVHSDTGANAREALSVFTQADLIPELTPNSNGTVSFEWNSEAGEAHIEIGKSRYVGSIHFRDGRKYSFLGLTDRRENFLLQMKYFAAATEAVLFPHRRAVEVSSRSMAAHVRYSF